MYNESLWVLSNLKKEKLQIGRLIAIYGVGTGTKLVMDALREMNILDRLKYILDRDDAPSINKKQDKFPICRLEDICQKVDTIIIAARMNHSIVYERVYDFKQKNHLDFLIVDPFETHNTVDDYIDYVKYLEEISKRSNKDFVAFRKNAFVRDEDDTRLIAWYLPQYHQIEINNRFHGQGFTEWTNSSQAMPQFVGHYQPQIPYDVGYYDLLNIDTFKRQIYLAHNYGIYGFGFHYYWFSGKRIMEKPLYLFLEHPELEMPFCINWANENWTSAWDGGNSQIMYEQKLLPDDDEKFMNDLIDILRDKRYIKIGGKPLVIIYRSDLFKKTRFKKMIKSMRDYVKKEGFPDLYILISAATRNNDDVSEWGGDGLVEYPPHRLRVMADLVRPRGYVNPAFKGEIWDMRRFVEEKKYFVQYNSRNVFRTALTSYDNTARRGLTGATVCWGITPEKYQKWLSDIIRESIKRHSKEENMVFVNAWNEWAEGAHLEPDIKYGYAYLDATARALDEVCRGESI